MDTNDGRIYEESDLVRLLRKKGYTARLIPMEVPPTEAQMLRKPPKVGRNELCPCGSGLKFKKCHLGKEGDEEYMKKLIERHISDHPHP